MQVGRGGSAWRTLVVQVRTDEPTCRYCGKVLNWSLPVGHPDKGVVDHIIPIAKGGPPLERANLTAACHSCNSQKGDREDWTKQDSWYSPPRISGPLK